MSDKQRGIGRYWRQQPRRRVIVLFGLVISFGAAASGQEFGPRPPVNAHGETFGDEIVARIRRQQEIQSLARRFPVDLEWGAP